MTRAKQLFTNRLKLRDIEEKDADYIVRWRSDENVYRYFRKPYEITKEEHLNWFFNSYIDDHNRYDWIAFEDDNTPIGVFGIRRDSLDSEEAEISYIVSPSHYRKGYAAEAINEIIEFCKNDWNIKEVYVEVHKDNQNSISFAKKLGFCFGEERGKFLVFKRIV